MNKLISDPLSFLGAYSRIKEDNQSLLPMLIQMYEKAKSEMGISGVSKNIIHVIHQNNLGDWSIVSDISTSGIKGIDFSEINPKTDFVFAVDGEDKNMRFAWAMPKGSLDRALETSKHFLEIYDSKTTITKRQESLFPALLKAASRHGS